MYALIIKSNGIELARQYHPTWDAAHVASMNLVQSVQLGLEIVKIEPDTSEETEKTVLKLSGNMVEIPLDTREGV